MNTFYPINQLPVLIMATTNPSSSLVNCPVCSREFPFSTINDHVDVCLRGDDTQRGRPIKRQRSGELNVKESCDGEEKRSVSLQPDLEKCLESSDVEDCTESKSAKRAKTRHGQSADNRVIQTFVTDADVQQMYQKENSFGMKKSGTHGDGLSKFFPSSSGKFPNGTAKEEQRSRPSSFSGENDSQKHTGNVQKTNLKEHGRDFVASNVDQSSSGFTKRIVQRDAKKPEGFFKPLAERMRPVTLENFIGQQELFGDQSYLRKLISKGDVPSLIFWGPPGCGKTTLACIIAKQCKIKSNARFVKLSACTSNVAEVKKVISEAQNEQRLFKRKTVLFMDEIHRFNKLQQDTFLPFVENGTITLLGATTENPSFQLNSALLSRCKVIVLSKLSSDNLENILTRALSEIDVQVVDTQGGDEHKSHQQNCEEGQAKISREAVNAVAGLCDGDARSALNALEIAFMSHMGCHDDGSMLKDEKPGEMVTVERIKDILQRNCISYDRVGDEHYNCISALHKSMRGSDPNAALYWLARMLLGGEDPRYIARRLVQFSSEDVGLADPQAFGQAISTFHACQLLGMPECQLNLAQCVIYLSRAPKSQEVFLAFENAKQCIMNHKGPIPGVPLHLRNASTKLMKELGYGKGYNPAVKQTYLPDCLKNVDFFTTFPGKG